MKFSNGFWLLQDDVKALYPIEVRDVKMNEKDMTIYACTCRVTDRGDTLNRPMITINLSSPMADVIKVKITHFDGVEAPVTTFELTEEDTTPEMHFDKKSLSFTSGKLSMNVNDILKWESEIRYNDSYVTSHPFKGAAYIEKDCGETYIKDQLNMDVSETIYGLGERFTPFVKNGQVVDIWNEDGGTCSDQSYKNIPFYLSSKGYGLLVNHPEKVSFEVASEVVSRVQFSVPGESMEYFIIGGKDNKEVLSNYTSLTGKPGLPPAWSFGLWLTTSFTTSYDEETVNSFIDGMADRDIPLEVFHFDCFWMKEFEWCNFTWDRDQFPDPEGMLERLKKKGLKNCLWINSYIAQKSYMFQEGKERGYLVRKCDGSVWQTNLWQAGMGLVDFTNPDAVNWYKDKLKSLVNMGVDSFKTDFGERIPTEDVVYFNGADPYKMHNYYTYLYNRAVYEVLLETKGADQAMLFARSATVGSQKFPVHWGGDCTATYQSMAESLRGGLSLCLSGFGFWSHDIGGFEQTATADLYKRWCAFGLLSTHSRLHGSESYRVPWNFDEEAVEVLRFFTKLKISLMPYIYNQAMVTAKTGVPMMRAMFLEFPEDPNCNYLDTQYMLGDSLLVAPVFNKEGVANYYLPEGRWISLIDGSEKSGNMWYREEHSFMSIPLYVRENSLIATGPSGRSAEYDFGKNLTISAYNLKDGESKVLPIKDAKGCEVLNIEVTKKENKVYIKSQGSVKIWKFRYNNSEPISYETGEFIYDI